MDAKIIHQLLTPKCDPDKLQQASKKKLNQRKFSTDSSLQVTKAVRGQWWEMSPSPLLERMDLVPGAFMPPSVASSPHLSPQSHIGMVSGYFSINSLFVGGPADNNLKNQSLLAIKHRGNRSGP